jgi:hypothetical protein
MVEKKIRVQKFYTDTEKRRRGRGRERRRAREEGEGEGRDRKEGKGQPATCFRIGNLASRPSIPFLVKIE